MSNIVVENMDTSDVTLSGGIIKFNFKLTEKTARANLLKSANRNYLEMETKQKT